ncbi:F-box/FBD/LRR-repeat protein At1g13570-like [Nicotiana tabacum]|uniref:F-box/FBD/LRR-repeat protein At1g13570-like n=1 Tax=Nicotiana tabacum TaxID=4097 RepID=A0A1S3ZYA6_TOBAC
MIQDSKGVAVAGDKEDRISYLPRNVIDHILDSLPIQDAARTSIPSKYWRYICSILPSFVLNKLFCNKLAARSQYVFKETIDKILLQHLGDVVIFDLDVSGVQLSLCPDIDRWMLYVTRNGVKKLTLNMSNNGKVPQGLPFTLNCLWHLRLGVNFSQMGQISYTLELIKSSHKLSKLEIWGKELDSQDLKGTQAIIFGWAL